MDEALCTRHGGKHAGDDILKCASNAIKSLDKPKKKDIGTQPKKSDTVELAKWQVKLGEYEKEKIAYDAVRLELEVLSTTRAYHYFKVAWKDCLYRANGDVEKACNLIKNISAHLAGMIIAHFSCSCFSFSCSSLFVCLFVCFIFVRLILHLTPR